MEPLGRGIYEMVLQQQDELRQAAVRERLASLAKSKRPGRPDRFRLLAGDLMIRLGERLKHRNRAVRPARKAARP